MKGFEIKFNVYAENEEEVEVLRKSIIAFINYHAENGRAVTASKLSKAIDNWDSNPFVKSQVIKYFK